MKREDIKGAGALVTGGANPKGIGAGVARYLAGLGAYVVIADINEAGRDLAEEIGGHFIHCDVSNFKDNERAVATAVEKAGGLNVVFLNAGIASNFEDPNKESDPEKRRQIIAANIKKYERARAINLDGVFFGIQAAFSELLSSGGEIIATASIASFIPTPLDPIYGASKAGVANLVRSLGISWARAGIRVNAICPGFVDTEMINNIRPFLQGQKYPLLAVSEVVEAFGEILVGTNTGERWYVLPGVVSKPFESGEMPDLESIYPGISNFSRKAS